MNWVGVDGYTWRQALRDCLTHFKEEKEYLANILNHTSGHDSFIQHMAQIHIAEVSAYIKRSMGTSSLDSKMEMYIRLYCMGTVCLSAEWILGQIKTSVTELAVVCENSVPLPMRPLLLE